MDMTTTKFIVQYKVREWWHDYYTYSSQSDAMRAADHLPGCISSRPVRIVERTTTDIILSTREPKPIEAMK